MDARKFVVGNVGPIGCIPYQKTINQLNEDQCVDLANKLALQYNAKLKDLLANLNKNLLPPLLFMPMSMILSWNSSSTMTIMVTNLYSLSLSLTVFTF